MSQAETTSEQQFANIPLASIRESSTNPRRSFDQAALEKLAESIADHGVAQPILVRPITPEDGVVGEVEIVFGARRFRASKLAKVATIPAIVRVLTDKQVRILQTIENIQREDVNPIEEADGYQSMMKDFDYTADMLAAEIKKSRAYIYGRLKLCSLPSDIRTAVLDGKLSASTAELIARMPSVLQSQATQEIIDNDGADEPMSYRAASEHIKDRYMLNLVNAIFPITDAKLIPKAGSCEKCPKRTGNCPELFQDVKSADVCTDPDCFAAKNAAHNDKIVANAKKKGVPVFEGEQAEEMFEGEEYSTLLDYLQNYDRLSPGTSHVKRVGEVLPKELLPAPAAYAILDGKPEPLFKTTTMQLALEKAGLCETQEAYDERIESQSKTDSKFKEKNDTAAQDMKKQREETEIKEAQAELHTKFRKEIYSRIRTLAGNLGATALTMSDAALHIILKQLVDISCDYCGEAFLRKLWEIDRNHPSDLKDYIESSTGFQLQLIVMDIAVANDMHIDKWSIDGDGKPQDEDEIPLFDLAREYGINIDEVRNEMMPQPETKAKKEKVVKTKKPSVNKTAAAAWPFPTKQNAAEGEAA